MKYLFFIVVFVVNSYALNLEQTIAPQLTEINVSELKSAELTLPGHPFPEPDQWDMAPSAPFPLPAPVPQKIDKKSPDKTYTHLWMNIRQNPSWKEAEAYDYSNRIETRVRKIFDNRFDVTMNVDMHYEWSSIDKVFDKEFHMFSHGINLRMNEWGSNYNVSGSVTDANNQYKYINLTMYKRFDDFSYSISGFGIYLNIDRYNINGNFDDKEYSKKAIAAIVSMALALQIEKTPATPTQTISGGQAEPSPKK
jgi:hypothetical protein